MNVRIFDNTESTMNRNIVMMIVNESTTYVEPFNSSQLGQETFFISNCTSDENCLIFLNIFYLIHPIAYAIKKRSMSLIFNELRAG